MRNDYQILVDESGIYVAHNLASPAVFVEAKTEDEVRNEIALAEVDLASMQSDRPALRSKFSDVTRHLLSDYGFVNRGLGAGRYEVWAQGKTFLTVPVPIRAVITTPLISRHAFWVWRQVNGIT